MGLIYLGSLLIPGSRTPGVLGVCFVDTGFGKYKIRCRGVRISSASYIYIEILGMMSEMGRSAKLLIEA